MRSFLAFTGLTLITAMTAMATTPPGGTASPENTNCQPVSQCEPPSLCVNAIVLSCTKSNTVVTVTGKVTIKNGPVNVQGATVYVTWTRPSPGTPVSQCVTTNSYGIASFTTTGKTGTFKLTVTNVTKQGYTYHAGSLTSKSITKY